MRNLPHRHDSKASLAERPEGQEYGDDGLAGWEVVQGQALEIDDENDEGERDAGAPENVGDYEGDEGVLGVWKDFGDDGTAAAGDDGGDDGEEPDGGHGAELGFVEVDSGVWD